MSVCKYMCILHTIHLYKVIFVSDPNAAVHRYSVIIIIASTLEHVHTYLYTIMRLYVHMYVDD